MSEIIKFVALTETPLPLFVANNGEGPSRVVFIRSGMNADPSIERVDGTNIFIMGGIKTRTLLTQLLSESGRRNLQHIFPGGLAGKTHSRLREYLGVQANTKFITNKNAQA